MTEYQVTWWRELPSMVAARDGDQSARALLAPRFQGAIDEAAMRLGDVGSDDYLAGWTRGDWKAADGTPDEVAAQVAGDLEARWTQQALTDYLDTLGPKDQP